MTITRIKIFITLIILLSIGCAPNSVLTISDLKCEYQNDPTGIDETVPRFGWLLNSTERNQTQTAFQILVSESLENLKKDKGEIWNSGKIISSQTNGIQYSGSPLLSKSEYFWKVKVWDKNDKPSSYSPTGNWSMGILNKDEWKAAWIGMIPEIKKHEDKKGRRRLSARYLRKEIAVDKEVEKATVYICGLGYYKLSLNGRNIGDHVLDPILRDYDKQLPYNTYDISAQLKKGLNCIGVVLGNGRFFAPHLTVPTPTRTYGYPQLLFQLEVKYTDGSTEMIISDESWKITNNGPIGYNNDYDGEYYDARKEMQNWDNAAFDDTNWQKPHIIEKPGGELTSAACMQPMRVTETIKPTNKRKLANGNWSLDLGQNLVGKYVLKVKGEAGTKIRMHFAETVTQDGEPYYANLRDAECTDYYILKGTGKIETYSPSFTYHGYRYVEVEGLPQPPNEETFIAEVVHTDMSFAGDFECSNQTVNQILENARWGLRGNYLSIPTDCPQRDERQGWQGDRAAEQQGETFMFDNILLYEKWLDDIRDSQLENGNLSDVCPAYWPFYSSNVTWPSAYLIIPGNLYLMYGDKRMIERHYEEMGLWMSHLRTKKVDGILANDSYGDWCCPPEDKYLIHSKQEWRKTPKELLATSYYYHNLNLMAQYAEILGNNDHAKAFNYEAKELLLAFNKKLYDKEGGFYGNGSQTSQILPLYFNMVPGDRKQKVLDYLINHIETKTDNHIGTGLIGGQWLMRTLSDFGYAEKAYQFATHKDYPSWGYMLENGATTIWELWNGNTADPVMNSGNHVMLLGDFMTWCYEYLAGIKADIDNPGFKHIIMKPIVVGNLKYVNANYKSVAGEIVSNWKSEKDIFKWDIVIPVGSTATVYIPARKAENITERGKQLNSSEGVEIVGIEGDSVLVKIGSGKYQFQVDVS